MDDVVAVTLDNWSTVGHPGSQSLCLMGIPGPEDTRDWIPNESINTSRITKVVRSAEGTLVYTMHTWYKLATVDPGYLKYREMLGLSSTDPIAALIDWAKAVDEVEFEDRAC